MTNELPTEPTSALTEDRKRALAIQRIKAKHDFQIHFIVYIVVNAALVILWYMTSQESDGGLAFFWPIIVIVGWGIGLALHAYVAYFPPSLTEEAIRREMERLR